MDRDIRECSFACCCVWFWISVSHTWIESGREKLLRVIFETEGGLEETTCRNNCSLLDIVRTAKTRRKGWTVRVARMENKKRTFTLLVGNPNGVIERDRFEDLGLGGRIILKCMLRHWDGRE